MSHHGRPAISCRCGCCAHLRGDEAVDTRTGERAVHFRVMTHHCKRSSVGQRSPQCRSCTHILIFSFGLPQMPEYNEANLHNKVLVKHRAAHHGRCFGICFKKDHSIHTRRQENIKDILKYYVYASFSLALSVCVRACFYPILPCQGAWALGWA